MYMSSNPPFVNLQNGFYNALSQGLGFAPGSPFQLLQPSPPLVPNNNEALWNYFNNIPPFSLTQNYISSGGNQFFSDYRGLISALVAPPNTFQQDIGNDAFSAWIAYVTKLSPIPAPNQLPNTFLSWAMIFFPTVAQIGAQDLSAMLLDPVSQAGLALMPYYGTNLPNWSLGYTDLVNQLKLAPSRGFTLDSSSMDSNVSNSWTKGSNSGFFGLWGGSSYTSKQSSTFASGTVHLTAGFEHVLTFVANPGNWYTSAAMGNAFANKSGPPWNPKSSINWQNTFGSDGNMQRFAVNLIVADHMFITATSTAVFDSSDRTTIENNSSAGLWPFYSSGSSSSTTTSAEFNSDGSLTILITSQPGVPIVIGCSVIPVAEFVGHSVEGEKKFMALKAAAKP